jgi:hypothetical protein
MFFGSTEIKFRISDDLFVFITLYKVPRFGPPRGAAPTRKYHRSFNSVGAAALGGPRPRRNVRAEYSAKLDFRVLDQSPLATLRQI